MPLRATDAKLFIRALMDGGLFVVPPYARKRMEERNLCDVDVINVLRGGACQEAEYENGCWRYQVRTARIVVVVEFDPEPEGTTPASDTELVVVTAWRLNP